MKPDAPDHRHPDMPPEARQLLLDQREANEQLVLATLRADELREVADQARVLADAATERALAAEASAHSLTLDLQASERELVATASFREQLLAIIGHDLRNPLGAITMAAAVLRAHGALDERDTKLVTRIEGSADRMARLLSRLVRFTRARVGSDFGREVRATDLREICRNVVEELRLICVVPIEVTLEGDLTGTWDPDLLAEVLSNITGNAADHAAPGTSVLVRATGHPAEIAIEISNQGEAIPPDVMPGLFKAFHHGRRQRHAQDGHLGLGLYVACQGVLAHAGALSARSEAGTTTFSIRLPRQPPDDKREGHAPAERPL